MAVERKAKTSHCHALAVKRSYKTSTISSYNRGEKSRVLFMRFTMKAATVLLSLASLFSSPASGFRPVPTVAGRRRLNVRFMSANSVGDGTGTASFEELSKEKKTQARREEDTKQTAISALEKLIERQQSDLKESERLLRLFKSSESQKADIEEFEDISRSLSTAASLISGFDYGFLSRSEGAKSALKSGISDVESFSGNVYEGPPANILELGIGQFNRNLDAMKGEYNDEEEVLLSEKQECLRTQLEQLTLNSTAIWERELADGPIVAPWIIKLPYLLVCYILDHVFDGRYVPARFYLLETVARMPYFSYITMLHLYETVGFWRRSADMKRVHFAEELNEYNHLLIMESLGGDQSWWVRFVASHSAIVYYVVLCILWAVSPSLSYRFSELLETHAVNTYGVLIDENEELLKKLPPSLAAVEYYSLGTSDPFYAEFQTGALSQGGETRRPGEEMRSMYDVFCAIRADERDHVETMQACLDPSATLRSASMEMRVLTGIALFATVNLIMSGQTDLAGVDVNADVLGAAADSSGTGLLEAAVAGIGTVLQQLTTDGEESGAAVVGADLLEGAALTGATEGLKMVAVRTMEVIARFLGGALL